VALAAFSLSYPAAAADHCKELTPAYGPTGYTWRGNRCEGIFVSKVSGTLTPFSFTQGRIRVGGSADAVAVSWETPEKDSNVVLTTRSMNWKQSYQMLAKIPASLSRFEWPSGQILTSAVTDLAVRALTHNGTYIPVRAPATTTADYVAAFYSPQLLSDVVLRVKSLDGKEIWAKHIGTPPDRVVQVTIPQEKLARGHVFLISLGGRSATAPLSTEFRAQIP
jgi:hypothetical protein